MQKVIFKKAYFLKLGEQGKWEDVLKEGNKTRISWVEIDINDIHKKNWPKIRSV